MVNMITTRYEVQNRWTTDFWALQFWKRVGGVVLGEWEIWNQLLTDVQIVSCGTYFFWELNGNNTQQLYTEKQPN